MWQMVRMPHQDVRKGDRDTAITMVWGESFTPLPSFCLDSFRSVSLMWAETKVSHSLAHQVPYGNRSFYSTEQQNHVSRNRGEQWLCLHCICKLPLGVLHHSDCQVSLTHQQNSGFTRSESQGLNRKAGLVRAHHWGYCHVNTRGLVLLFRSLSNELSNSYSFRNHLNHLRYTEIGRVYRLHLKQCPIHNHPAAM